MLASVILPQNVHPQPLVPVLLQLPVVAKVGLTHPQLQALVASLMHSEAVHLEGTEVCQEQGKHPKTWAMARINHWRSSAVQDKPWTVVSIYPLMAGGEA